MTEVYGATTSGEGPLAWGRVEERLERARSHWIATTRLLAGRTPRPCGGYGRRARSTSARAGVL
jgi:hypothetical protein